MKLVVVPWLPSLKRGVTTYAITISPYVFIIREQKDNEAIIEHEMVHIRQVDKYGWWTFYWRYITSGPFRREMEAAGYLVQRLVENRNREA